MIFVDDRAVIHLPWRRNDLAFSSQLTGVRGREVKQEEEVPHHPLRDDDRGPEEGSLASRDLEKSEQMHSLVF